MPSPESLFELISSRRTVHNFSDEQPPKAELHKAIQTAIDAARWAPNHGLSEPWNFYHLGSKTKAAIIRLNGQLIVEKTLKKRQAKLSKASSPTQTSETEAEARATAQAAAEKKATRWASMPEWLVVTQTLPRPTLDKYDLLKKEDYAATACAIQNFMLMLHCQELGAKWATGDVIRHQDFYKLLALDAQTEEVVGLFWVGKADSNLVKQPKRRKAVNDIYHLLP